MSDAPDPIEPEFPDPDVPDLPPEEEGD